MCEGRYWVCATGTDLHSGVQSSCLCWALVNFRGFGLRVCVHSGLPLGYVIQRGPLAVCCKLHGITETLFCYGPCHGG